MLEVRHTLELFRSFQYIKSIFLVITDATQEHFSYQ